MAFLLKIKESISKMYSDMKKVKEKHSQPLIKLLNTDKKLQD